MKILIMGSYVNDKHLSLPRFETILENGLKEKNYDVRILRPKPVFGYLLPSATGLGKWLGYVDKFIIFPCLFKKEIKWADIIHVSDQSKAIYVKYLKKKPHLITCHDLLAIRAAAGEFKESKPGWSGKFLQQLILKGLKQSTHVICDSEATKSDFLRLTGMEEKKVSVIYLAPDFTFFPQERKESVKYLEILKLQPTINFFLHVGGDVWYKNRLGVIKIFNELNKLNNYRKFNLIFVGAGLTMEMRQLIREYNIEGKVYAFKSVSEETLRALYSLSEALLYPSVCEGFGWPIIEAQACGCPVITTNKAPMAEIAAQGAIYIESSLEKESAGIIAQNLKDKNKIKEAGFLNLKRFSLKAMIENYISVYKNISKEVQN